MAQRLRAATSQITLSDVLKELPFLERNDLMAIRARVNALLTVGGGPAGKVQSVRDDVAWVLDIVASFSKNVGIGASEGGMLRKIAPTGFADKVAGVLAYLERAGCRDARDKRAALTTGLDALHRDLTSLRLASSPKLLMMHLHRIPSVVNREFPGYAAAGILRLVWD